MVGTRFVVLKLKELVRIGIFVLIGLAVVVALIAALLTSRKSPAPSADATEEIFGGGRDVTAVETLYSPGTYSAQIVLHNTPLVVSVTVGENTIEDVAVTAENEFGDEFAEAFYPLFKPTMETLSKEIIKAQSTNVDADSEAVYTSKILLDAVNSALSKAKH